MKCFYCENDIRIIPVNGLNSSHKEKDHRIQNTSSYVYFDIFENKTQIFTLVKRINDQNWSFFDGTTMMTISENKLNKQKIENLIKMVNILK